VEDSAIAKFTKEYFVAAPLLGSALAVTFDVGYFSGIDINLFSIFTISEHLVFALEALPLGVVLAIGAFIAIRFNEQIDRIVEEKLDSLKLWSLLVWVLILLIFTCGFLIIAYDYGFLQTCLVVMAAGALHAIWQFRPPKLLSILFWNGVIVFGLAYSLGYDISRDYVRSSNPDQVIQTQDVETNVLLIRSGDKGVLFYNPKNKSIELMRWDAIKKIARPWKD
jgi:hypothetical protein